MSPKQFSLIEDIFQCAIELPAAARGTYLDRACAADPQVRQFVEELLRSDAQSEDIVGRVVGEAAEEFYNGKSQPLAAGQHLGPYEIVREIGKGGMGVVYQARRYDSQYERFVAIKIISQGLNYEEDVARFRIERQVLAALHHPNIATLLDGGTTEDGRPYIIMEYIEGEPLLQYCKRRSLPVAERLKLFCNVCEAVNHAHQMLVIHRDIKPGNVLVTADGVPKLLDFGIAKLISSQHVGQTEDLFATRTGMLRFTPQYASPEQIHGSRLTTVTDVYSLGVLLYELLTYTSPYAAAGKSLVEIGHAVCEEEPTRLSRAVKNDARLRRELEGDLENIVAMAMRKEPDRRYSSALQFANDIQLHLKGLPVTARHETILYILGKFVRRNKLAAAAFALLAVSVLGGWFATIHQARRTEARFREVRELANSLLTEIPGDISRLPNSTPVRAKLVRKALGYLNTLSQDASHDVGLQFELAQAYDRVGDVQGDPEGPNLGQFREATDSYEKSLALVTRVAADRHDFAVLRTMAWLDLKLGDLKNRQGDTAAAHGHYEKALQTAQSIETTLHDPRGFDIARHALQRTARSFNAERQLDQAVHASQGAVEAARRFAAADQSDSGSQGIAAAQMIHGDLLVLLGQLHESRRDYEEAVSRLEQVNAHRPSEESVQTDLAEAYRRLGNLLAAPMYFNFGEPDKAVPYLQKALNIEGRLAQHDSINVQWRSRLALAYRRLGHVQLLGEPGQAAVSFAEAIAISEKLLEESPGNFNFRRDLANHRQGYAMALARGGQPGAAHEQFERVLAVQRQLTQRFPAHAVMREDLFHTLLALARVNMQLRQFETAEKQVQEALHIVRGSWERAPRTLYAERCLAVGLQALGDVEAARSARGKAEPAYRDALAIWTHWRTEKIADPFSAQREREVTELLRRITVQ